MSVGLTAAALTAIRSLAGAGVARRPVGDLEDVEAPGLCDRDGAQVQTSWVGVGAMIMDALHLPLGADNPAAGGVAQHAHLAGLRRRPVLDLEVDRVRLGILHQQLLLERREVGGVVDVPGEVKFGAAKPPREPIGDAVGRRVAQACRRG